MRRNRCSGLRRRKLRSSEGDALLKRSAKALCVARRRRPSCKSEVRMHCSTNRRYTRNFVSVIPSFTMMHKGNSAPLFSLLHDGLRLRVMHRVYFHCTHSACFRAGTPPGKKYKAKDKKRVTQNAQLQNYPRLVWQACANSAGPGRGPGSGTRCPENSIPAPISSGRHYLTFRPRATPRRDALPFSRAHCCPRSSATSVSASVFTPPFFLPRAAKNRKLAGKKKYNSVEARVICCQGDAT